MPRAASRTLLISAAAEQDLAEIWAYIAEDSVRAATAFVTAIETKFKPLLRFPEMGSPREKLAAGLRAVPYKSYVIYYVHTVDTVTIVRVVHSARDVRALF